MEDRKERCPYCGGVAKVIVEIKFSKEEMESLVNKEVERIKQEFLEMHLQTIAEGTKAEQ